MIKAVKRFDVLGGQAGFSMVEISLALMVVAMGLLVLMGLFPAGLKEVDSAVQHTKTAMFADDKLNQFQANTLRAETLTDFKSLSYIFGPQSSTNKPATLLETDTVNGHVQWKYFVTQTNSPITHNQEIWRVRLEVKNGRGAFVSPVVFYTELVFGVPPP